MNKLKYTAILFLFLGLIYGFENRNNPVTTPEDSLVIRNIYSEALVSTESYENLMYLCKVIGGRLTGSKNAENGVNYVFDLLKKMNIDNVYKQDLMVRNWVRGEKEIAYAFTDKIGRIGFNVCALGTSVGTGENGISGSLIEVKSFDELKVLGRENIEGKIVFFNRAADERGISTGYGYGSSVDQRVRGAIEGARYGAIGVVVRSATVSHDNFPHTGIMRYNDSLTKIPAVGISTKEADELDKQLGLFKDLKFYFRTTCHQNPDVPSNNVIGEIKGSEHPEEIILVSGHLDSWDLGEGAHDDGTGVIQGIEVLRLYQKLGIKPKHTIRFVAFMDEEIDQAGGRKYAELTKNEKHIAAIESDGGGFVPFGFSMDGTPEQVEKLKSFQKDFEPYWLFYFRKGGGGVDISFLKKAGIPLIGLVVDSQRYFDYHHSGNDVFENVNRREMQLGSAAMASLIFLIDKYGL
jgi:carboxypeptidase Q